MLARFQGGLFDGVVLDISNHTRDSPAPDRLRIEVIGDGPQGCTEVVLYYLMRLTTEPDPADGVLAIYGA